MPDVHSRSNGPSLWVIERPLCPNCATRTSLARIMPGPEGFDLRNFECRKCDYAVTLTVSTDPMKSDAINWINGGLNPPK